MMVGDGPLAAEVDAAVGSLGPARQVRRVGWVDDLPEQLGPQDVLVVTSRSEAAPYLFLEAAAAGAWILTLDVGGVEELSRHYERMTVLPQGSTPADIAAALVEARTPGRTRPRLLASANCSALSASDRARSPRGDSNAVPPSSSLSGMLDSSPRHPEWRTSERSSGAEVYWGTPNAAAGPGTGL